MSLVRTVLGDVDPAVLGIVDAHDHLLIVGGPGVQADPDIKIDSVADAVAEAEAFKRAGGGTIVDAMPSSCGRDALGLVEVARQSGVHVIATAGFHKQEYYADLHWSRRYPLEQITRVLLEECTLGIDRWDSYGPLVERTGVRPGLLKIATGYNAIRIHEQRWLGAVAAVYLETGLSIITHTEHGTAALRQLDALERHGVPSNRVAIGHLDRNPDLSLHAAVAERGAFILYDALGRERYHPISALVEVLQGLIARGFGDRIMLGGDIAKRSARLGNGATGISGLLTELVPRLERDGIGRDVLDAMLIGNPARFLPVRTAR